MRFVWRLLTGAGVGNCRLFYGILQVSFAAVTILAAVYFSYKTRFLAFSIPDSSPILPKVLAACYQSSVHRHGSPSLLLHRQT